MRTSEKPDGDRAVHAHSGPRVGDVARRQQAHALEPEGRAERVAHQAAERVTVVHMAEDFRVERLPSITREAHGVPAGSRDKPRKNAERRGGGGRASSMSVLGSGSAIVDASANLWPP